MTSLETTCTICGQAYPLTLEALARGHTYWRLCPDCRDDRAPPDDGANTEPDATDTNERTQTP